MSLRRSVARASALSALAGLTAATSLFSSACRKSAPSDSRDAASMSDASNANANADGATAADEDAAAALPDASAGLVPTTTELASLLPPSTPFSGTYRCFGGMKLDQAGRIVTATIHKGTTDTVIACTAGPDTCTGTVREIVTVRGKPPKVLHVKPITLTRTKNGDIVYVVTSPEKKAGHGDQTFCPHR